MHYQAVKRHRENLKEYYLVKDANLKMLCDSKYMTFWKSQTTETIKRPVVARGR